MTHLTIVCSITAKSDKIELLKTEFAKVVEPTRAEEGCIRYVMHQDNNNPAHILFYETWENQELRQTHTKSEHIIACAMATQDAIESFTVSEMTAIS